MIEEVQPLPKVRWLVGVTRGLHESGDRFERVVEQRSGTTLLPAEHKERGKRLAAIVANCGCARRLRAFVELRVVFVNDIDLGFLPASPALDRANRA